MLAVAASGVTERAPLPARVCIAQAHHNCVRRNTGWDSCCMAGPTQCHMHPRSGRLSQGRRPAYFVEAHHSQHIEFAWPRNAPSTPRPSAVFQQLSATLARQVATGCPYLCSSSRTPGSAPQRGSPGSPSVLAPARQRRVLAMLLFPALEIGVYSGSHGLIGYQFRGLIGAEWAPTQPRFTQTREGLSWTPRVMQ